MKIVTPVLVDIGFIQYSKQSNPMVILHVHSQIFVKVLQEDIIHMIHERKLEVKELKGKEEQETQMMNAFNFIISSLSL